MAGTSSGRPTETVGGEPEDLQHRPSARGVRETPLHDFAAAQLRPGTPGPRSTVVTLGSRVGHVLVPRPAVYMGRAGATG